jgi:hypothetical protein
MSIPKGLKFTRRLAETHDGWLFVCQRRGHPPLQKYLETTFKTDAESFRAAHDTAFHAPLFQHVGFEPAKNIVIAQLCEEWLAHVEQMERDGIRKSQTTRHYDVCCQYVVDGMKAIGVRTVRELDPSKVSAFIRWMRKSSKSEGALIVKTLSALKTMIRWKGLPADWRIPHDEIRAKKREKRDLDSATIRRLIRAMTPGSVEEAVAYLKARTGARDVEIREATPEEFDLANGVFAPMLHSKRKQKRHVYALTDDVVAIVRPFVKGSKKGEPVFTLDGRPLQESSLRRRLIAASKRAKIKPPIRSLAPIRAEVVTLVADSGSMKDAAAWIGHEDEQTSRRWYYKDKLTAAKLKEKRRIAEVIARAIPLRHTA